MEPRMRLNDGVVDHEGRYWAGTMDDPKVKAPPTDEGVLFRLDPDMTLHRMIEKVSIPNGICFSPNEKIMYFIDSPTGNGKPSAGLIFASPKLLFDLRDVLQEPIICFSSDTLPGQVSLLSTLFVNGNADSRAWLVWQFDYDRRTGDISNRKVFYHVEGDAVPDGMVIDVNGCLCTYTSEQNLVSGIDVESHDTFREQRNLSTSKICLVTPVFRPRRQC